MWARFVNAALGIWLMAAPAVLGYGGAAQTNDRIAGPLVATCAIIALWEVTRGLRWVNFAAGLWMLVAPWLLGYGLGSLTTLHSLAVGAAVVACALVRGRVEGRYGGGWGTLVRSGIPPQWEEPN